MTLDGVATREERVALERRDAFFTDSLKSLIFERYCGRDVLR
jgi:hypothetical protein